MSSKYFDESMLPKREVEIVKQARPLVVKEHLLNHELRQHYLAKAAKVLYDKGYLLEPVTPEIQHVYSGCYGLLLAGELSCHVGLEFKAVRVRCLTSKPHDEQEFNRFMDDCLNIATRRYLADDDFMESYYKCLKTEFLIMFFLEGHTYKAVYRGHDISDLLRTKASVDEICTYINYVEDGYEYRD